MTLLLEDQEDKKWIQNLRIRGVPEVEGPENLPEILQDLFQLMLNQGDEVAMPIRLERAIRVMRSRLLDLSTKGHSL